MKKNLTYLILCITLVSFSQKKKSSKTENDAIEKEMRFIIECSAIRAFNSTYELKTDRNLNDYLRFKVCNDQTTKRIIGVVVGYKQEHMPLKEIGRVRTNVNPKSIGYANYYPNFSVSESMFNQLIICKYIYSDNTTLRL